MNLFNQLIETVRTLRGEAGCPWDREQTVETLTPYLLEEVYEVLHAIESADMESLPKELGDLLFQIVLLAQITSEEGLFSMDDVIEGITEKMVRRHPHVFDSNHISSSAEGSIEAWETRKAKERPPGASALDGLPKTFPALLRAYRMTEKASRVGFDWPDYQGVRAKLDEEIGELDEACDTNNTEHIEHEYGDLLFTVVNMGRFLPVTPEEALRKASNRFETRFRLVEDYLSESGENMHEASLERLEHFWKQAKEATCSLN